MATSGWLKVPRVHGKRESEERKKVEGEGVREERRNIMLVKNITRIFPSLRGGDIGLTSQWRSANSTLEDEHVE